MIIDRPLTLDHPQTHLDARWIRSHLLDTPAEDITVDTEVFKGIHLATPELIEHLTHGFARVLPEYRMTLAFGRESPAGQVEPNDIHSDSTMGDLTAILYLNPDPPPTDGTIFWERSATGQQRGVWDPDCERAGHDRRQWGAWFAPRAHFGRLLLFPSDFYHSRALADNYGDSALGSARLILAAFFRRLPPTVEEIHGAA